MSKSINAEKSFTLVKILKYNYYIITTYTGLIKYPTKPQYYNLKNNKYLKSEIIAKIENDIS